MTTMFAKTRPVVYSIIYNEDGSLHDEWISLEVGGAFWLYRRDDTEGLFDRLKYMATIQGSHTKKSKSAQKKLTLAELGL